VTFDGRVVAVVSEMILRRKLTRDGIGAP